MKNGQFDLVQAGIIFACRVMEQQCRKEFYRERFPRALAQAKKDESRVQIKEKVKNEWERIIQRSSY